MKDENQGHSHEAEEYVSYLKVWKRSIFQSYENLQTLDNLAFMYPLGQYLQCEV
jgi:hypothetical protein